MSRIGRTFPPQAILPNAFTTGRRILGPQGPQIAFPRTADPRTPGLLHVRVTLAVQPRRVTEKRRFPLQGWKGTPSFRSNAGTTEYDRGVHGQYDRLLGPRSPLAAVAVPSQRQQTVAVRLVADHRRRTEIRRFPKQWLEGSLTKIERTGNASFPGFERALGPDPPSVIASASVAPSLVVYPATGVLTNSRRAQQRRTAYALFGVVPSAAPPLAPPLSVNALAPDRLARRQRRQLPSSVLGQPILPATGFVAPPVTVVAPLVPIGRHRRRPLSTILSPPTVLVVFAGPQVNLLPADRFNRKHRRGTLSTLGSPIFYPSTSKIDVTLVRTRPRPTTLHLRPLIFYPAASTITVALVRARPRPTTHRLAPPTTLQTFGPPVEVEVAVRVPVEDRRRRPNSRLPLVVVPVAGFVAAPVEVVPARIRPRRTLSRLAPPATLEPESVALAEREIRVTLIRTRPRPTRKALGALIFYPQTSEISVTLVDTRPRPTRRFLAAPTVLATFAGPTVSVVRIRPRPTEGTRLAAPTVLGVFAGPTVTIVRTRPRATVAALRPPTVVVPPPTLREQTVKVTLAGRTRIETQRRTARYRLRPPTVVVVNPPVVTEITVSLAEPKNRRNWNRHLAWQGQRQRLVRETGTTTTYQQRDPFIGPRPPVVIDPLPTQRAETITTWLVSLNARRGWSRSLMDQGQRQRPTRITGQGVAVTIPLRDPFVGPRPPQVVLPLPNPVVVVYPASGLLTNWRRAQQRRTDYFLAAPAVVGRQPVETVLSVTLAAVLPAAVRAHRQARAITVAPVEYPQSGSISVTLTRVRPRPTAKTLAEPTVVRVPEVEQLERTIRVVLTRTRPRATIATLTAVSYPASSEISVTVVQTRPRPTVKRLAAPTVTIPLPAFAAAKVTLATTRPRPTTAFVAAPTVVVEVRPPERFEIVVGITRVSLVQRRPFSKLSPPAVVAPAPLPALDQRTIRVSLVRIRPRPTTRFLERPSTLRPPPPPIPLWTDGEVLPTAETEGEVVETGASGGSLLPGASASGQVVLVAESAGEAEPLASADGTDERTGLT